MVKWLAVAFILSSSFGITSQTTVTPYSYPAAWVNKGEGKSYVLYQRHNVRAMSQANAGSCVGAAYAKSLEIMHGVPFSAEWSYGISRKQFDWLENRPGSSCAWAAQSGMDIGCIPAYNYAVMGYDLSEYSADRANHWQRGPPETLELVASRYRSQGFVHIETWEQLRDAISQGYPVIVGSSVGFGQKNGQVRDELGRLRSKWWSRWNHAMLFCGVSDGKNKQALLLNSWGHAWITGPKFVPDEPDGSFWVSKSDAQKMLSQGDAWAILPIRDLPL